MRTLRAVAVVATTALSTALLTGPAGAATPDLSITSVTYLGGCGGDLVQLCSDDLVSVDFADPTPGVAYRLRIEGGPAVDGSEDSFQPAWLDADDTDGPAASGFAGVPLRTRDLDPSDFDGRTLRLTIEELDEEGGVVESSSTTDFVVHLTQRPDPRTSELDVQPSNGTYAVVAGRRHAVTYRGRWQAGAVFTKEVGLGSRSGQEVQLLGERDVSSPSLSFTVPRRYVGWRLQAVVRGRAPGAAEALIGWPASIPDGSYRVVAPQPSGWVRSNGTKAGRARVGSTVRLGKPSLSAAGRAKKPSVRYQWLRSGAPIPRARAASRRLTAADRGRTVSLRVTYQEQGYADRSVTVRFGTVRG